MGGPRPAAPLHPLTRHGLGRFDRAIHAVEEHGLEVPVDRWRELRELVRAEVMEKGWNEEKQTFVQHYDTTELDASLLTCRPRLPRRGRPEDGRHHRGRGAGADARRPGPALPTETGVDGLAGESTPSWPAPSGSSRPMRRRACWPRRRRSWTDSLRWATTSGCCPRSTTRSTNAWWATSPRRSRTSPSSARPLRWPRPHRKGTACTSLTCPRNLPTETERLVATAERLGDAEVRAPSLCPGWTRGHVLTHLARNAEALVRVCGGA